jgi:Mg2+ and Co2+ transporter CorA
MRIIHITGDQFQELNAAPEAMPEAGYLWFSSGRREFEVNAADIQAQLALLTGGTLVDLHVSDLLNNQLPSHFDYTSWYDLLVFRRLAAGSGSAAMFVDESKGTLASAARALEAIDTGPVGFAVFDRVLLSVHPADCAVRDFFALRLSHQMPGTDPRGLGRMPSSPADLMLRMVNHIVDSYLELRRLLTRQFTYVQQQLFSPASNFDNWKLLVDSRGALHKLEDVCEDQRSAITEWIDAMEEWPAEVDSAAKRERELLRVRSRDVLEHIERVLNHVRRLESSAETAVQIHFAAQSHRTNSIMRTLTVLTAIFLPLNLVTGFFGMNFEGLPLIHSVRGFWVVFFLMLLIGVGSILFFWRRNYLDSLH